MSGTTEISDISIGGTAQTVYIAISSDGINKNISLIESTSSGNACVTAEQMTQNPYNVTPTSSKNTISTNCTFPPGNKHWLRYDLTGTNNAVIVTSSSKYIYSPIRRRLLNKTSRNVHVSLMELQQQMLDMSEINVYL